MEVGRARASLHIEHLHRMLGVVPESIDLPAVDSLLLEEFIQLSVDLLLRHAAIQIVPPEGFVKRGVPSVTGADFAGSEVDGAGHGGVDAAQVQHQFAIHIQPEVIVAGELEDDIVTPGVQSVCRLCEAGAHLHAEMIIHLAPGTDVVQLLTLARIRIREFFSQHIVLVRERAVFSRCQIVIGHKLAVIACWPVVISDGAELVIDCEAAVRVQMRKVLCAVVFKISALIVDALEKEMVRRRHRLCRRSGIQFLQALAVFSHRIAVFLQIRRKQACFVAVSGQNRGLNQVSLAGSLPILLIVVVDHTHRNAVGIVVHGSDGRQLVTLVDGIDDGKVEVLRL